MKKILFIVVLLILYGSFYPWRFQPTHLAENPLWILLHSWPVELNRWEYRDIVVNVALYVPFGIFSFLSLGERHSSLTATGATLLGAALLSSCVEMSQLFEPQRVCSMFDVSSNVAGAAAGIVLAGSFPKAVRRAVSGIEATGAFRLSEKAALLYLWLGYQLFPLFPSLGRTALRHKLSILLSGEGWAARDLFESVGGWLAVAALVESLAGPALAARLMPAALLLIPAKLFIADRTMSGSELTGAVAGIVCWMGFRRLRRPGLAAGILAVAALLAGGLLPFRFPGARLQTFIWVPFLAMLQSPWESAFVILFRKSFLYGSAIWLFRTGGLSWLVSSLCVAIPLAVVEGLQMFLPGRTPESTDPLLALLLGCCLMLLDRHSRKA